MKDFIVHIKRELKDHGGATIKLSDIHGLKWSRISGGRKIRTAYPYIYGYIIPDNIISGEVACSGTHNYENGMKILILEKENKDIYPKLLDIVGERPTTNLRAEGQPPCTKKILLILNERGPLKRKDISQELLDLGYFQKTICGALNRLKKDNKIEAPGYAGPNQVIKLK